jgi:hypothetical protein
MAFPLDERGSAEAGGGDGEGGDGTGGVVDGVGSVRTRVWAAYQKASLRLRHATASPEHTVPEPISDGAVDMSDISTISVAQRLWERRPQNGVVYHSSGEELFMVTDPQTHRPTDPQTHDAITLIDCAHSVTQSLSRHLPGLTATRTHVPTTTHPPPQGLAGADFELHVTFPAMVLPAEAFAHCKGLLSSIKRDSSSLFYVDADER